MTLLTLTPLLKTGIRYENTNKAQIVKNLKGIKFPASSKQGCQDSCSLVFHSQGTRTHFKTHFYPFLNTMKCSDNLLLSFHRKFILVPVPENPEST